MIAGLEASKPKPTSSGGVKGVGLLTIDQVERRRNFVTSSQLALFVLCGYYILGLLYYSIGNDHLSPLDTIYFATQTLTSIGYGDINYKLKKNHHAFTAFYCIVGAGLVAVHFSCLASNIVQRQELALKMAINKIHEKIRQHVINDNEKTMTVKELEEGLIKDKGGKVDVGELYNELFNQELREIRSAVVLNFFLVLVVILVGAGIFSSIEKWDYVNGVYWACATVTTTGYGDVSAVTDAGKIFSIIYILASVGVALKGFAEIVRYPILVRAKKNELEVSKQFITDISPSTIKNILKNDFFDRIENLRKSSTTVQKSEFVLMLLQMMGKTSEKDVIFIARVFDSLDSLGCGEISEEQLNAAMMQAKERERIRLLEQQKELEQGIGLGLGLDNLALGALGDLTTGLGNIGSAVGSGLGNISSGLGFGNFLVKRESESPQPQVIDNPIHSQKFTPKTNLQKSISQKSNNSTKSSPSSDDSSVRTPTTKNLHQHHPLQSVPISDLIEGDLLSSQVQEDERSKVGLKKRPHGYSSIEHLGSDLIDYSIDSEVFGDDVGFSPISTKGSNEL